MPGRTILETERLLLREFVADDAAACCAFSRDPIVTRYTGDQPPQNVEEARALLLAHPIADYAKHGFGRWACVLKDTEVVVGFCGLKFLDELGEVDIGYRLQPDCWGKGLATECARATLDYGFEQLNLRRIIGLVHPDNAGSIRVLEKLSMHSAGVIDYHGEKAVKYVLDAAER
jgi:RimJ/RimL family protein N-acetyltransferase